VLAASGAGTSIGEAPTMVDVRAVGLERLREVVDAFDAKLEVLADGSLLTILIGASAATDMAQQAALCALALRPLLHVPMALATGRAEISGRLAVGDVVERAAALASLGDGNGVQLDDATAGLLDARFEVVGAAGALELRSEREVVAQKRTLLGKATPCVGREREIATLLSLFETCVADDAARIAVVTGPAGIGKSRVRQELIERLNEREEAVEVWMSRGDSVRVGSPFAMVAPPIRRSAGIREGEPIEVRRKKLTARVARGVAEAIRARVTAFAGELIGTPFPDELTRELASARRDPIVMGDQMRIAWQDFVDAETHAHPVVLILEDLQWGDLPSVNLIDLAMRNLAQRPWLVVAFARPDVSEIFPNLWKDREPLELPLGGLTRKAGEKLVRAVLADTVSDVDVARIVERGAGNAFYLEELVRAHADGRGGDVPETVLAMVEMRLGSLEPALRRVLRAASVFGQTFWSEGASALLGDSALTNNQLQTLAEHEIIAHVGDASSAGRARALMGSEWSFRHANLRDAAYGMLTGVDRALGHKLAAEWLEGAGDQDAVALAEHWEKAGENTHAIEWYRRAAGHALEGNDFAAAIQRAERATACGAAGETLGELWLTRIEANIWQGDFRAVAHACESALGLLPKGCERWFTVLSFQGVNAGRLGDIDGFANAAKQLLELCPRPSNDPEISCAARFAVRALLAGPAPLATKMVASLSGARPQSPTARAWLLQMRAVEMWSAGEALQYARLYDEGAIAFEEAGDVRKACMMRVNAIDALKELGDHVGAEASLRQVLVDAERMGLRNVASVAKNTLGIVLARAGRVDEALAVERDCLADVSLQGDRRMIGMTHLYLARIHSVARDFANAEQAAREALATLTDQSPVVPYAQAALAEAELQLGRPNDALNSASRARAALENRDTVEGAALVHLVYGEALHATDAGDAARNVIRTAREALIARAAKITDARQRENFLENIPEHARTLQRAREWVDSKS
jgi:tetratricopeptide (TPR) repeat protein